MEQYKIFLANVTFLNEKVNSAELETTYLKHSTDESQKTSL